MHIPDSMLQGRICPVSAAISAVGVAAAAYYGVKSAKRPSASYFGAIAALIFAGQMMNFPIANGTSGHLLGGVLAASLLGTPFGVLAIALVVTIQSLVFSDGGLTVLGANVFNMAILGAGVGGMIRSGLEHCWRGAWGNAAATAAASWFSVVLASCSVSVQLALDGQIAIGRVLPAMVLTHALIGLGEAGITVLLRRLLSSGFAAVPGKGRIAVPFGASVLIALLLSPFASGFPDGLEYIAEKYRFLHESAPVFAGPLADYAVPALRYEALSTGAAGLAGVVLTFGLAWLFMRLLLSSRNERAVS